MDALERAGGPEYHLGTDPGEPDWVTTRDARFEGERARMRGADFRSEIPRDWNSCPEPALAGHIARCE